MFKNHVIGARDISIHALVKRATKSLFYRHCKRNNFNPRPRKEGDLVSSSIYYTIFDFNPRPRKEGDYGS